MTNRGQKIWAVWMLALIMGWGGVNGLRAESITAQIKETVDLVVEILKDPRLQAAGKKKVITGKGDEIPIDYRLHSVGGKWKVYDVVIENVSLVNNYRSQFNRILATASFDELIKRLQEKTPEAGRVGL